MKQMAKCMRTEGKETKEKMTLVHTRTKLAHLGMIRGNLLHQLGHEFLEVRVHFLVAVGNGVIATQRRGGLWARDHG